jgi:hypothetical protein
MSDDLAWSSIEICAYYCFLWQGMADTVWMMMMNYNWKYDDNELLSEIEAQHASTRIQQKEPRGTSRKVTPMHDDDDDDDAITNRNWPGWCTVAASTRSTSLQCQRAVHKGVAGCTCVATHSATDCIKQNALCSPQLSRAISRGY